MINREDMLELTRRMTLSRHCFSRIAGCYLDREGYDNGSFNIHFGKLKAADQKKNLMLAKKIPFADTNVQLKEHAFPAGAAAVLGPQRDGETVLKQGTLLRPKTLPTSKAVLGAGARGALVGVHGNKLPIVPALFLHSSTAFRHLLVSPALLGD